MQYKITGQVRVKETGKPFPGLIVQVHDTDMEFDGCLGAATTDQKGRFSLVYSEQAFREVFEKEPEIYLAVYAPPLKHLLDTKKKVRWGDSDCANFDIVVSGKKVSHPTKKQENQVQGSVSLSAAQLKIDTVDGLHVPRLPGFGNGTLYGSPSILEKLQYVVIPAGARVKSVEVDPGPAVRKGRKIKPFPIQHPYLDIPDDRPDSTDPDEIEWIRAAHPPKFIPLDPRYVRGKKPYPQELVTIGYAEEHEGVQLVRVHVRPLQYDPVAQQYLFYPKLRYTVHYQPPSARAQSARRAREAAHPRRFVSQRFKDLLERKDVYAYPGAFTDRFTQPGAFEIPSTPMLANVPYLIITDDFEWSETSQSTTGSAKQKKPGVSTGNYAYIHPPTQHGQAISPQDGHTIVGHFRRLAMWKAQRGVPARVVTVKEIVDKVYDDMTLRRDVSARDLQEVIRNFVLWAFENWGVEYLLLGGDINIIPMRKLIGYVTNQAGADGWDCMRVADEPIERDQCKYYPGYNITKIHYCGATPIWMPKPLLTHQGGKEIKYYKDVPSDHFPRWYFVSQGTFEQELPPLGEFERLPPEEPTYVDDGEDHHCWVIVEDDGNHLADINDDYYWVSDGRMIPTDRYYACASSPENMESYERDFDKNGNGFPGQFRWSASAQNEVPIDGFKGETDVHVGRAPVRTAAEAEAFVDKVISYERLAQIGTAPRMNTGYLKNIVHVADYSSTTYYKKHSGTGSKPSAGKFVHNTSGKWARIQIDPTSAVAGNFFGEDGQLQYRLIMVDGFDDTKIPHGSPGSNSRCWFFTKDNSYSVESSEETSFVKVINLDSGTTFSRLFWDPTGLADRFHLHAETLRGEMNEWYPDFDNVKQVYHDWFDDSSIIPLTDVKLRETLDAGCHLLAAVAHGGPSGFRAMRANSFQEENIDQLGIYIVNAESCSTAYPEQYERDDTIWDHSLGEMVVVQKGGGAVAYVGAARMDGAEEKAIWFWDDLRKTRRLGPASAACEIDHGGKDQFYYKYCRMLYGDPEMPVWTRMPKHYVISWPMSAARGGELSITVRKEERPKKYKIPGLIQIPEGYIIHGMEHPDIPVTPATAMIHNLNTSASSGEILDANAGKKNTGNSFILTTPAKKHLVTLRAGWDETTGKPEYFFRKRTDNTGKVHFHIPEDLQAVEVEITVCACDYSRVDAQYDYIPATRTITITP